MTAAAAPDARGVVDGGSAGGEPAAVESTDVELFIYYRVPASRTAAAFVVARDCQRCLRAAHPGLAARLLRRAEPSERHETWMETYRVDAGTGIDAALESAIELHARPLARFIDGPRHVERFTACA